MGSLRSEGEGLRLAVTGEQWWWRVSYSPEGGGDVVHSANDIRLSAGRRAALLLDRPDVIHSFWIPPLGGKTDMIPGRTKSATATCNDTVWRDVEIYVVASKLKQNKQQNI